MPGDNFFYCYIFVTFQKIQLRFGKIPWDGSCTQTAQRLQTFPHVSFLLKKKVFSVSFVQSRKLKQKDSQSRYLNSQQFALIWIADSHFSFYLSFFFVSASKKTEILDTSLFFGSNVVFLLKYTNKTTIFN